MKEKLAANKLGDLLSPFDPEDLDACDPIQPLAELQVLEAIEAAESDVYHQYPVSILCPGCSEVVTRYQNGLPSRLARFNKSCERCETALQRWSVVGITTALERTPTQTQLQNVTTTYWDRHLWDGIMTGESYARTREYTREYTEQAKRFCWEWEVTCPLCRQSLEEAGCDHLDYHHWNRSPDHGICLCRACHEAISGGGRDQSQDWQAQQLGLKDKHDLQITRLAVREQALVKHDSLADLANSIQERYNLIQTREEVVGMLHQTLSSPKIRDHITDDFLFRGLPLKAFGDAHSEHS